MEHAAFVDSPGRAGRDRRGRDLERRDEPRELACARRGWRSTTVKAGDKVSVLVYPLRNDEKGGQYISITLPDGKVLTERDDGVVAPAAPQRTP